jgi:hypothetical protein
VLFLLKSLKKGEPWYKVVIYGLLLREFDTEEGIDLVVSEIKTFNKGLEPIRCAAARDELLGSGLAIYPEEH